MITTAKELVSINLATVSLHATLAEAQEIMKEKRVRHLPVVSDSDRIVGVISQRDLMNIDDMQNNHVAKYMSLPVEIVNEREPLRLVILKMLEKKISSVLIVDDSVRVVGIVTTDDVLWCFAQTLSAEKEEKPAMSFKPLQLIGDLAFKISNMGI